VSRNIEVLPLRPESDRFTVIGGHNHNQDYAVAIANTGIREQGDHLLDAIRIRVLGTTAVQNSSVRFARVTAA
jgi:hypothetical protein